MTQNLDNVKCFGILTPWQKNQKAQELIFKKPARNARELTIQAKRTKRTIRKGLKWKNTVHFAKSTQSTRKQNNNGE